MALFDFLKSTLLSKVVMAVTGVIIVLFVLGHTIGNLQIFIGAETFNHYAHFLQGLGELLWIIRGVLLLALVLHIITSIRLKYVNWTAKPIKYKVKRFVKAKLTSRTMIWTGIMIFAFLLYHILHFTGGVIDSENFSKNNPEYYTGEVTIVESEEDEEEGKEVIEFEGKKFTIDDDVVLYSRPDAYFMVIKGFRQPLISIIYIIGVILMGFHLSHAIQSMFQTLGLNHPKYNCLYRGLGPALSTFIVLCLISIPISIVLGLVGGCV